jgi:hypothetical protein
MPYSIQDAVLIGITALGLNPTDKVVLNASIYQLNSTVTISRAFQAPARNTNPINVLMTATGDASGTSDVRMQREIMGAEGPNNFADVRNRYAGVNINTAPGTTAAHAYTDHSYVTVTGGGALGTGRAHFGHFGASNGSYIHEARVYEAGDLSLASGGKVNISTGLRVANIGNDTDVNYAYGVQIANFSAAHLAVGMELRTMSGRGKWAIRAIGDAPTALAGKTRIGSTAQPQHALDVTGDAQVTGVYRFANGVIFASGPGMPSYPAAKGSLYLSTDFGMVQNTDGNMGWVRR